MADLIRNEIDRPLLKLNPSNLIVKSHNLNIDIKGETNKRNILRLIQKHIDGLEGEEHLAAIKEGFEKEFVPDVVTNGNEEDFSTSRVSG